MLGSLAFPELCSIFSLDISAANDSIILVILSNLGFEDEAEEEEVSPLYLRLSTRPFSFSAAMILDSTSKAVYCISARVAHLLSLNNR